MDTPNLGDGAKNSCERFIKNATEAERRKFYESEDITDLYHERGEGCMPQPRPTRIHVEYMLQHLEEEYGF